MQVVLIALSTVALIYLALCAALLVFQRSLLYFPQPSSLGSRDTTISLRVADAKVVASVRPRVGSDAVIYFGGNGEDVTGSAPGLMAAFPDHALYLLHYRGYGGSAGTPSEAAIVADALALFDEARREHRDIVVVGRSLGSGVAVRVASLRPGGARGAGDAVRQHPGDRSRSLCVLSGPVALARQVRVMEIRAGGQLRRHCCSPPSTTRSFRARAPSCC